MEQNVQTSVACAATVSALALALSACSGGGGFGVGSSADEFSTVSEIERNYALTAVNADRAYELGYTGQGVAIAVIDTGADRSNSELRGALHASSWSVVSNTSDIGDAAGHGTSVAGVIAAARNQTGVMGVAYNSSILAIKADSPSGSFQSGHLKMAVDYALSKGAPIVNMSLAGPNAPGASFYNALDQAVQAGTLFVIASGNSSALNPEYPARYAGQISGTGQVLAVGSVNSSNQISSFSSRAGNRKDFYLVAPGENVSVTTPGNGIETQNGTSFAAPVVAAAASILKEQASHLSGRQIADLLLQTATDLGVPGVDDIYGHGLLDIGKALQPYGVTIVPSSTSVTAETPNDYNTASNAIIFFDPAFAKAIIKNPLLTDVMALDDYGRPYNFDLSSMALRSDSSIDMLDWLQSDLSKLAYNMRLDVAGQKQLRWGMTPAAWADHGALTEGRYVSYQSTAASGSIRASMGLPATTVLGYSATLEDGQIAQLDRNLASIRSAARHAAEIPYLSFSGQSGTAAVEANANSRLTFRAAVGSNRTLSSRSQDLVNPDGYQFIDPEQGTIAGLIADSSSDVVAAETQFQFTPKFSMSFTGGRLSEKGSFLGSYSAGALSVGEQSVTNFAGVTALYQALPTLQLFGGYTAGRTRVNGQGLGLVRDVSSVRSSAFTLGMTKSGVLPASWLGNFGGGVKDSFTMTLSQPLRVESGRLTLDVPTARDEDGTITRAQDTVGLAPSGRQLDLFGAYDVNWQGRPLNGVTPSNSLSLLGGVTHNPDHDASADDALTVGVKFRQIH